MSAVMYPNKLNPAAIHLMAVYGTLRSSAVNGCGIVQGYNMYHCGLSHSNFPIALETKKVEPQYKGDPRELTVNLLSVDRATIERYDKYEHEGLMYKRVIVDVIKPNETVVRAHFYEGIWAFWKHRRYSMRVEHGNWNLFNTRQRTINAATDTTTMG